MTHTPRGTGFGKIAVGIADALSLQHAVHLLGVGPAQASEAWAGLAVEPIDIGCTSALRTRLALSKPDVLLLVGVNTLTAWQAKKVRADGYAGILVAYVPVEGPIHTIDRLQGLRACTAFIAYHATGAQLLSKALGRECPWIYHGADIAAVPSTTPRQQLRHQLLPAAGRHTEKVWILNANRHDGRKCPELTLRAFATIHTLVPAVVLVMHCNPKRPGVNLRIERDRLGLLDQVIFTRDEIPGPWSDAQLSDLYSCCEIGVSSALGEGWGLIPFEHALRGGAQILPAHAGLVELWEDAPQWVPVSASMRMDAVSSGLAPNVDVLAAAMLALAQDATLTRQKADACGLHARRASFSWDTVGSQWLDLIARLLVMSGS